MFVIVFPLLNWTPRLMRNPFYFSCLGSALSSLLYLGQTWPQATLGRFPRISSLSLYLSLILALSLFTLTDYFGSIIWGEKKSRSRRRQWRFIFFLFSPQVIICETARSFNRERDEPEGILQTLFDWLTSKSNPQTISGCCREIPKCLGAISQWSTEKSCAFIENEVEWKWTAGFTHE